MTVDDPDALAALGAALVAACAADDVVWQLAGDELLIEGRVVLPLEAIAALDVHRPPRAR